MEELHTKMLGTQGWPHVSEEALAFVTKKYFSFWDTGAQRISNNYIQVHLEIYKRIKLKKTLKCGKTTKAN